MSSKVLTLILTIFASSCDTIPPMNTISDPHKIVHVSVPEAFDDFMMGDRVPRAPFGESQVILGLYPEGHLKMVMTSNGSIIVRKTAEKRPREEISEDYFKILVIGANSIAVIMATINDGTTSTLRYICVNRTNHPITVYGGMDKASNACHFVHKQTVHKRYEGFHLFSNRVKGTTKCYLALNATLNKILCAEKDKKPRCLKNESKEMTYCWLKHDAEHSFKREPTSKPRPVTAPSNQHREKPIDTDAKTPANQISTTPINTAALTTRAARNKSGDKNSTKTWTVKQCKIGCRQTRKEKIENCMKEKCYGLINLKDRTRCEEKCHKSQQSKISCTQKCKEKRKSSQKEENGTTQRPRRHRKSRTKTKK